MNSSKLPNYSNGAPMVKCIEAMLFLVCTYRQTNAVVSIHDALMFAGLVDVVYGKFGISSSNLMRSSGSNIEGGVADCNSVDVCDIDDGLTSDMEDRTDLLLFYCSHKSKMFLSTRWAYAITHVGQIFLGQRERILNGLMKFKYVKNDFVRITTVCKFATSTRCAWLVHVRVSASNGVFCLKRFSNVHSCGAAVCTYRNPHTGSNLVSDAIADHVHEQPLTCLRNIVFGMKNDFRLDISYRVAWLGIEKARGEVYGDHAMSFDQLRWYSNAVIENNPRSYINLDFDQQSGRGDLRAICSRLPLRMAIKVFHIHFRQLLKIVDEGRTLTFVSDRNIGLLQSMTNVFPSSHHAFCLLYLQMNLRDRMKYVSVEQKFGLMHKLRE
ncbi:hypothetical protein ACSBR1_029688 [Camellia fascicularis]